MDFSQIHPVFAKQIEALAKDDMETLMAVYHPEIVSLRFQGPVVGRQAARDLLKQYEGLDMEFVGIDEYVHSDDMIMTRTRLRVKKTPSVATGSPELNARVPPLPP